MYDVIVCGTRCAGAPTAMLLARKGYEVLLLDRAGFPSDLPHGHLIHRDGPGRLAAWGLLDRVTATTCPPITTMTTDYGDHPLTGMGLERRGVAMGYPPRDGRWTRCWWRPPSRRAPSCGPGSGFWSTSPKAAGSPAFAVAATTAEASPSTRS